MDQAIRNQVLSHLFESSLFSSHAWVSKADDLLSAAALLEPQVKAVWSRRLSTPEKPVVESLRDGTIDVHLMLVGFAIESLLKAVVVREKQSELRKEVGTTGRCADRLRTHSLVRLAAIARLEVSLEEEGLLRKLSRATVWSGRYPVPIDVARRSSNELFSDGSSYAFVYNWPRDIEHLRAISVKPLECSLTGNAAGRLSPRCRSLSTGRLIRRCLRSSIPSTCCSEAGVNQVGLVKESRR